MLPNCSADRLHDPEIDSDQIIPAHARLARHSGGHDDDIGTCDRLVLIEGGAGHRCVLTIHRGSFGDVEAFAFGDPTFHVDEDDIAQLLS